MAMKMTNGKVRHEPRVQLHTHPSTLTPQTHWHIASRNQDNWRRLSDSPWGRSNWTLDILAWKEHTRSVRQNHIKGTDIPLRPSKSRIRVWYHFKLTVKTISLSTKEQNKTKKTIESQSVGKRRWLKMREWSLIMGGTKKDQRKVIRSNSSVGNLTIELIFMPTLAFPIRDSLSGCRKFDCKT